MFTDSQVRSTAAKAAPSKVNVPTYGRNDATKLRRMAWNIDMWLIPTELKGLHLEQMNLRALSDIARELRKIADEIESAPGPVAIALTHEDGGVPIAIARDVLTIMRTVLA